MRIAVSGASGLIGSKFCAAAKARGHETTPLVRDRDKEGIYWSVDDQALDVEALDGVEAIVHLAGESIAGGRWTEAKKRRILVSRVEGTSLIAKAIAAMEDPPELFIGASAIGYYGDPGEEWVDEDSPPGEGFLADVCRQWEAAYEPARAVCRVVKARFGVVLAEDGGALNQMLTPFKIGLGGRLGRGQQYMSWVDLDDVAKALLFMIDTHVLEGPVNVVAPNPVPNKVFTKALGKALGRPTIFPVPAPALKLAMGSEMADQLLLVSQRVRPKRLLDAGFNFNSPTVDQAFQKLLAS